MRALRLYGKMDLRVDEVARPTPGTRQILIRPAACGICGTDLHEYAAGPIFIPGKRRRNGAGIPQILGHEFAGVVTELGEGVRTLEVGDRVSIQPQMGPTDDYFGARGLPFLGPDGSVVGLTWPWGGMAEFAVVPEANAIKIPDDITDVQGALVEPTAVAVHAVDRSGAQPGDSLLITGGGPIGALVLLAARAAGVTDIIVSEPVKARRTRIEDLKTGAVVIDPSEADVASIVRERSKHGVGVDAAIECAGNPSAINNCIDAVRSQGTVLLVGLAGKKVEIDPFSWTMRDITVRGSLNYPLTIWPRIFELMRSGYLPAEQVVDGRLSLQEAKGGFDALLQPESATLKLIVGPME